MQLFHARKYTFFPGLVVASVLCGLTFSSNGRADRFPPDPVEELRQALRLTIPELARQDPAFAKRAAEAKPEEQPKLFQAEKERILAERVQALRSLSDLRRALVLREWTTQDTEMLEEGLSPNQKYHLMVAQRFENAVRRVLHGRDAVAKLAVMAMLSEKGAEARASEERAGVGRPFARDFADLALDDPEPGVRQAAARTLGQIFPDPGIAAPALARIITSPNVQERRAAAGALDDMIRLVSRLTTSSSAAQIPGKIEASPSDLVKTGQAIVPVAARGLSDPDRTVRLRSAAAIDQAADAMLAQAPQRTVAEEEPESNPQYQAVLTTIMPLLNALGDQASALARAVSDPDPQIRIHARHALESLATARSRVRRFTSRTSLPPLPGVESDLQPPPRGGTIAPPAGQKPSAAAEERVDKDIQAAVPGLAAGLFDRDVASRLAALDVLEVLGPASAGAVPQLTAALRDPDLFVRWQSARTLAKIGPVNYPPVIPALDRLLRDPDLDVRLAACAALQSYGPAASPAIDALIAALADATDTDLRLAIMTTFETIGTSARPAIGTLIDELQNPDARARQKAAEVLGRFGPMAASAEPALRRALDDENAEVRRAASEALLNVLRVGT
jgi:HEAT repeat protein